MFAAAGSRDQVVKNWVVGNAKIPVFGDGRVYGQHEHQVGRHIADAYAETVRRRLTDPSGPLPGAGNQTD
jgi:hypothetical protein